MAVSTTTTTPTGWAADASYQNWLQAQQAIDRPYEAYPGNMLAGYSPNTQAGLSQLANGQGYGGAAMLSATNAAQDAANYRPAQVSGQGYNALAMGAANAGPAAQAGAAQMDRGAVRDVSAQGFLDRDVNAYMNPYIGTVVNNALSDLSRQNDIVNNTTNARAAAAGAFGGSRQAVANTLNNENYLRESGNLSGTLRNQGYNTAAQLLQQDNDRNLTAQGMNQTADWNVGSLNTANQQQAGLANMGAANQMAQYNAGNLQQSYINNQAATNAQRQFNSDINLRGQLANQSAGQNAANLWLSSANALNGMGMDQQTWNLNNANAQLRAGGIQQAQEQAALDNAYQRWQQQYNYPLAQAEQRRAALQGAPMGSASTQPYYGNTAANVVGGALGGLQAAAYLPSAINGVSAGYNALSSLLPSAASSMPNSIYDAGASTGADILKSMFGR